MKHKTQVLAVAFTLAMSGSVYADVIDDAYRMCSAMEGTGLTTECKVKGWGSTVDVRLDTNGSEARKICSGVVDTMAQKTRTFAGKWKLRIFSPYSGEHPIAVCTLQ